MRKFNLEEAKAGKPICTKNGLPVRIICWNKKTDNNMPIIGLVKEYNNEYAKYYTLNGECSNDIYDLYMAPTKHKAYVAVVESKSILGLTNSKKLIIGPFDSKEHAKNAVLNPNDKFISVGKVIWEE